MEVSDATKYAFAMLWGPYPPWPCFFCGKPITELGQQSRSLHRHHLDGIRENNDGNNLVPSHARCHIDFHTSPYEPVPLNLSHST